MKQAPGSSHLGLCLERARIWPKIHYVLGEKICYVVHIRDDGDYWLTLGITGTLIYVGSDTSNGLEMTVFRYQCVYEIFI